MITRAEIPLARIIRVSELNMNAALPHEPDEGFLASLATRGVLQSLVVRVIPETLDTDRLDYEVLAGRKRWNHLRQLLNEGWHDPDAGEGILTRLALSPTDYAVPVAIFDGTDAEAHLASISENFQRADHHPVDRYEAFAAAMEQMGATEDELCRSFGLTRRDFKKIMKLAALSPKVRAAWRKGDLTAEQAQLFTLGAIEEPDKFLQKFDPEYDDEHYIRRHFRKTEVPGDDRRALFVGAAAYDLAGGTS